MKILRNDQLIYHSENNFNMEQHKVFLRSSPSYLKWLTVIFFVILNFSWLGSPVCKAQSTSDVQRLYNTVLTDYNADVRPNYNQSLPTDISFTFVFFNIVNIDERTGYFSFCAGIQTAWHDHRIQWLPSDYGGIDYIKIPVDQVWTPVFMFGNPIDKTKTFGLDPKSFKVKIQSSGWATLFTFDKVEVQCDFNMLKFPFDKQNCSFFAWMLCYDDQEVQLHLYSSNFLFEYYEENNEWIIKDSFMYSYSEGKEMVAVPMYIIMERRWQFFILIQIVPICWLSILDALVFTIHVESGERIGYAITLLLSMAVFLTDVTSELPTSSKNMSRISYFLMTMLIHSSCVCMLNIVSIVAYHRESTRKPVPFSLQRLAKFIKHPLLSLKCCHFKKLNAMVSPAAFHATDKQITEKQTTETQIELDTDTKQGYFDQEIPTWKDMSGLFDKCMCAASLFCTFLQVVIFTLSIVT